MVPGIKHRPVAAKAAGVPADDPPLPAQFDRFRQAQAVYRMSMTRQSDFAREQQGRNAVLAARSSSVR